MSSLIDELDAGRVIAARSYAAQLALFAELIPVVSARREERAAADADPRHQKASLADREVVAEVAASLRLSERSVHARMSRARHAVQVFPAVHAALDAGSIDPAHADVICDIGTVFDDPDADDETRAAYAAAAVQVASDETAARTRGILTAMVSAMAPDQVEEQVQDAASAKCVRVFDLSPGLARLSVDGPTIEIHGMYDRLTRQAVLLESVVQDAAGGQQHDRSHEHAGAGDRGDAAACGRDRHGTGDRGEAGTAPGADGRAAVDTRTRDQIRADILIDQVLTGTPALPGIGAATRDEVARIGAIVTVTIPATTLAGTSTGGAMVPGHGPVDEATVKALAGAAATWTRVFTDPVARTPVQVDTYRPSAAQRRLLAARDEHCRFPGCRRPASRCDLDHTIAREHDGPTALWNLAHLCEAHHIVKHNTDWRVRQLEGGVLAWTGPTGRAYSDRPPSMRRMPRPASVEFIDVEFEPRHPLLEPAEYGAVPAF